MNMNPVIHFKMPAEDRKRMAGFYTKVFGWKTQKLGEEMGNYVIATTTDSDEKGRPTKPGSINGGFFQKTDDKPSQYPSVVIYVEDIMEHLKKVEKVGGKVLGNSWDIPGVGLYVSFIDMECKRASMLQPNM
jgi:predicted enzyme related to lactoylglutathione lyase